MSPVTQACLSARRDDRRFRELYRYFQPSNPAALPYPGLLPHGEEDPINSSTDPVEGASAVLFSTTKTSSGPSSSNATLTSFAQLAAVRLNAQRAIISVVDRNGEYHLAEATRSLNLRNVETVGPCEDALWLGCDNASRFGPTFSADTVALPASDRDNYHFHVIDDLAAHESYKKLSFVENSPNFRFYAGTPLTTENRINIGSLFVLDTKPRSGLTEDEKESLGTLASLVMDYLRVSRQASEGRRAARLSRGLSCFVEGSSSFVDGANSSRNASSGRSSASPSAMYSPAVHSRGSGDARGSRDSSTDVRPSRSPVPSNNDERITLGSSSAGEKADTGTSSDMTTPFPEWLTKGDRQRGADDWHSNIWAFRRAANLLRESMELSGDSGVIFLESGNTPFDMERGRFDSDENSPAPVLAISTNEEPFAPEPGSTSACAAAHLDRNFLQQILRRYPKGKIWSFHRDRTVFASSDDDEKPNPNSPVSIVRTSDSFPSSGKKWRATESALLEKYFPNASQVLFVPLWNAANSQWFAGCFCWNSNETKVFSPAVELASVMGFGYSIMAECSRVESVIADRQKGDFIGSISHELRSPLHGILAAAEFMDGTDMSEFQKSLLETINACGRTLLDTMNQVLDFSKIVSLEKSWRQIKKSRDNRCDNRGEVNPGVESMAAMLDEYSCEDIALLAEEVVEGVCVGHSYSRSASSGPSQTSSLAPSGRSGRSSSAFSSPEREQDGDEQLDVEVVVDVHPGDWRFRTQPGALRRIIMNIFGNAMKYTDTGRVTLRLETLKQDGPSSPSKPKWSDEIVVITVVDTGKGISEEFLRGRLFTPFAQEDTLAVGTGLGLSIVRSIVKSLGGKINVRSQPGEGTTVKVSLPLMRDTGDQPTPPREPSSRFSAVENVKLLQEQFAGKTIAILGYDPATSPLDAPAAITARYITEWFGLQLASWPTRKSVDILLANEDDLTEELRVRDFHRPSTMMVYCHNTIEYDAARRMWSFVAPSIEFIHRPCGPYKLARNLLRGLERLPTKAPTLSQHNVQSQHAVLVDRSRPSPSRRGRRGEEAGHRSPPKERDLNLEKRTLSQPNIPVSMSPPSPPSPPSDIPEEGVTGRQSAPAVLTLPKGPLVPEPPAAREKTHDSTINVLVVDDNQINLRLLLTYLTRRNTGILHSAENGKMAVEAVEKSPEGYDIIFMDISMPVMNGFEATRAIRALENERDGCKPATIIALTGLSSARDETEALNAGVDLFLTKPVSLKEVSRLLDEWEAKTA